MKATIIFYDPLKFLPKILLAINLRDRKIFHRKENLLSRKRLIITISFFCTRKLLVLFFSLSLFFFFERIARVPLEVSTRSFTRSIFSPVKKRKKKEKRKKDADNKEFIIDR